MNALCDRLAARIGQSWGPGEWVTVDQDMVDRFAEMTGDRQWIHIDPERARAESPFGGTVAHGLLILSLVPGLIETPDWMEARAGVNAGSDRLRFVTPVLTGSRVRAVATLAAVKPFEAGARVTTQVQVEVEGQEKPACVVDMIGVIFP